MPCNTPDSSPRPNHHRAARRSSSLALAAGLAATLFCGAPLFAQVEAKPVPNPGRPSTGTPQPQPPSGSQPMPGRQQPGAQPGAQPGGAQRNQQPGAKAAPLTPLPDADATAIRSDDPTKVTFSSFAEPVQLSTLVALASKILNINIIVQGEIPGSIVFNAPVEISKSELIPLLDSLLEQQGFTITQQNVGGFYVVGPVANIPVTVQGEIPTTRVYSTPNVRPSTLKALVDTQLTADPKSGARGTAAAIDELGILIVTDTARRHAALDSLIKLVLNEWSKNQFIRVELHHVASSVARERVLALFGAPSDSAQQTGNRVGVASNPAAAAAAAQGGAALIAGLDNITDRLTVDPQGNALLFRGLPDEIDRVQSIVAIIDVPTSLAPRRFNAGNATSQIANIARQRGMGEITVIENIDQSSGQTGGRSGAMINPGDAQRSLRQPGAQGGGEFMGGGPVMIVDEFRGQIIYYATENQHAQLDALIRELDLKSDEVVIRDYKLRHSKAVDVAEIIVNLLNEQQDSGGSLLTRGTGNARDRRNNSRSSSRSQDSESRASGDIENVGGDISSRAGQSEREERRVVGEQVFTLDGRDGYIVADPFNNQVLVKAPAGQQDQFRKLIEKLDQLRPQVYIEAKIVAVNADDRLRLAFETQLINANGTGGVLNTNFGLSSFAAGAAQPLLTPKIVASTLSGFTAAIIKSDQVPIIMNALARETDSRVISSPQLLVDDNEEAEVISVDQQPIAQVNRGTSGQGDIITSGGYESAGTRLTVLPQISEGGYLRLDYDIELSTFTGEATSTLPPPRQVNNILSKVTVPSDSTVVVGGLVVDAKTKTIAKIPLLGDIPLIGMLFQDRSTGDRSTVLYVFLTPKILRDPTFDDLKLLTRGPQARVRLPGDYPSLEPSSIDLASPRLYSPIEEADPLQPEAPAQPEQQPEPMPAPAPAPDAALAPAAASALRNKDNEPGA